MNQNLIISFIKLENARIDKILLQCLFSIFTANSALKGVLVTKGKFRSDLNTISDLKNDKTYLDFHQIEKYFEGSAWAECLKL